MRKSKALELVKKNGDNLHNVGKWANDLEVVREAMKKDENCVRYAGESILANKQFAEEVYEEYGVLAFRYFAKEIKKEKAKDIDVLKELVRCSDRDALDFLGDLKNDKKFIMEIVNHRKGSIYADTLVKRAGDGLKNDISFFEELQKLTEFSYIKHASDDVLRKIGENKDEILKYIDEYPDIIKYIKKEFQNEEFYLEATDKSHSWFSYYVDIPGIEDKESFAIKAVKRNPGFAGIADSKEKALKLVKANGLALQYINLSNIDLEEIERSAIENNPDAIVFARRETQLKCVAENPELFHNLDNNTKIHDAGFVMSAIKLNSQVYKERLKYDGMNAVSREVRETYDMAMYGDEYANMEKNLYEKYLFNVGDANYYKWDSSELYAKLSSRINEFTEEEKKHLLREYTLKDGTFVFKEEGNTIVKEKVETELDKLYLDEEKINNREYILGRLVDSSSREKVLNVMSETLKNDLSFFEDVEKKYGKSYIEFSSDKVKKEIGKDREKTLHFVKEYPSIVSYAEGEFVNEEFYLDAVEKNVESAAYAYSFGNKYNEFLVNAARRNVEAVKYCDDKDSVLSIVSENGLALEHARVKSKNIELAAIENNGKAIEFASEKLQKNKKVIRKAAQKDAKVFNYLLPALKDDNKFVSELVKLNPAVYDEYTKYQSSKGLENDRNIVKVYEEEKSKDPFHVMECQLKNKYGFNSVSILKTLDRYASDVDNVSDLLDTPKKQYRYLSDEEKKHILGNYQIDTGVVVLKENDKGQLIIEDKRTINKDDSKEKSKNIFYINLNDFDEIVDEELIIDQEEINNENIAENIDKNEENIDKNTENKEEKGDFSREKQEALKIVNTYGPCLGLLDDFQDDIDVVLAAVKNDPASIKYVSERLKNDERVKKAAGLLSAEKSVKEEEKEPAVIEKKKRKSSKMLGIYDDMPQDVKEAYDNIMKKTLAKFFEKQLTNSEIAYLNKSFEVECKKIVESNNISIEDARKIAVYKKINNRYKKIVKLDASIKEETDENLLEEAKKKIENKLKKMK